jgi:hypothetical protein
LRSLYFDVKAMTDTTRRVLEGVEAIVAVTHPDITLRFEYPNDLGQEDVGPLRNIILNEIYEAIGAGTSFRQLSAPGISVRIFSLRPKVTVTSHDYNPYKQAERLRYWTISDAKQLLRDDRNLRVLVVHPWFNLANTSDLNGTQGTFFRALARRLACELTRDERPLGAVMRSALPNVTVRDAAHKRTSCDR